MRWWRLALLPALAGVAVLALVAAACEPTTPTTPTTTTTPLRCTADRSTTTTVAYASRPGVDPNLLSLDLSVPARDARCGPAPVVVYVHGGGFTSGDKANSTSDKRRLFTAQGWAFASVNYRLSTPPPPGQPPVRHPDHVSDVAAAVAWIRSNAAANRIDPSRVLLLGHSSGAFLVSLASTDTSHLTRAGVDPRHVRCTASLDTEYDVAARIADGGTAEAMYRNAFGDDPAVWAQGSPITHTGPGAVRPSFLVVTRGGARRVEQSADFARRLRAGGTPAQLLDAGALDHAGVNAAVGAPGDQVVTPPLLALYRSCVAAP